MVSYYRKSFIYHSIYLKKSVGKRELLILNKIFIYILPYIAQYCLTFAKRKRVSQTYNSIVDTSNCNTCLFP